MKALRNKSDGLWQKYRHLCRDVKYIIRSKRTAHMKGTSDNSSLQAKRFWNFFNRLTSRPSIPDSVSIDGDKVFITPDTKPEALNYYFASVFNMGRVLPTDNDIIPYSQNNISEIILNREEVSNALLKIDASKTPGPDLIHPKILRECASELAPSLCALGLIYHYVWVSCLWNGKGLMLYWSSKRETNQ